MRDLPTGTITLLFTDIEGSTHLLQKVGERYAELLNECRTLLRTAFHAYHGHEVDTQGDAMFAAFARASDALEASVAAQRELALHSWPRECWSQEGLGSAWSLPACCTIPSPQG